MFQPISHQQILDLAPGQMLQYRINGLICGSHRIAEVVTGESNDGNAWAIGYVQLPTCKITFSILEGFSSTDYQLVS